jgi:hypothetical protein
LRLASSASVRVLDAVEQQCDRHRCDSVSGVGRSLAMAVRGERRKNPSVCGRGETDAGRLGAGRYGVVVAWLGTVEVYLARYMDGTVTVDRGWSLRSLALRL